MKTAGPDDATLAPGPDDDATLLATSDSAHTRPGAPDAAPAHSALEVGDVVGRYVVVEHLGAGGMGVVLLAHDRKLHRRVALKFVRGSRNTSTTAARLEREAQAMAKLQHPHVAAVYDVGVHQGDVYLAMEYVDGGTVKAWLAAERQPWRDVLGVFIAAGRGLEAAHGEGLIHRDFKPENMMLDRQGRVRVLDFGLARGTHEPGDTGQHTPVSDELEGAGSPDLTGPSPEELTRTGALMGTPAYMSPEQLRGRRLDARSDQFSFCVALFEGLYGQRPFQGPTMISLAAAITRGKITEPGPEARREVPARIHEVILRGLSVEAEERWSSMGALLEALEREPRRPGRLFGIGALVVASLGAGAFGAIQLAREPEAPPPPCTGLDHHLEGVWDEGRRTSLERHFDQLGVDGREAWAGVEPRLDAYAVAWADARTRNCRATEVQAEQSPELRDARNACLDRRKIELNALIGALGHIEGLRVHEAVAAASKLPSLATCASEESLRQDPQPTDPALAERAGELERQLAEVDALQKVGEHRRALDLARPLAEKARALGFGPLTARVLSQLGYAEDRSGTLDGAEQALREAYLLTLEHRLTGLAADVATDLAWVVGSQKDEHEEGRRWSQVARAHFLANGEANQIPGLMINHGAVELAAGRDEVARAVFEEGIALIEALPEAERDEIELATLHNNLGIALSNLGEQDAAVDAWTRGLKVRGRVLGEHHPHVAISYDNLAGAAFDRGDWAEATDYATRSLDIWTTSVGHAQGEADSARDTLVYAAIARSDATAAIRHARKALESVLERSDATDDDRSWARERLGYALMAAGDWEAARSEFTRSLELLDDTDENVPFSYQAHTLAGLGRSLVELGEPDEAISYLALVVEAGPDAGLNDIVAFSARFDHARAQWPSASNEQRSAIRTDLERLREEMRQADPPARLRLPELEAWLGAH